MQSSKRLFASFPAACRWLLLPLLFCLHTWALAQARYTLVFGPENSSPSAIDNAGRIAGQLAGRAFVWDGSTMLDIGTLGGPGSTALGLSENGFITGSADRPDGSSAAFLYRGGTLVDIGQLGTSSAGAGVNAGGQVAGTWVDEAGENHAFLYSGGVARDIGNLGANSARATGINGAGDVVGSSFIAGFAAFHAFLYRDGSMRDLGTLGGPASAAAAINDAGQIAGTSFIDDDIQHAFLYTDGVLQDIGSLGGALTEARGLNELGQVVGLSTYADDVPGVDFSSAFVYRDGLMLDLNLVTERPGVWTLLDAVGINDAGQIAAFACTESGDCRAVRLDPIPAIPKRSRRHCGWPAWRAWDWRRACAGARGAVDKLLDHQAACSQQSTDQRSMSMCMMPSSS
jgi:probable HAF family extracellular repeat protein